MGNIKKYSVAVCLTILGMFCLSIFVRLGTSKILWDRFHAEKVLQVVFFDNAVFVEGKLRVSENTNSGDDDINWAEKYPFKFGNSDSNKTANSSESRFLKKYIDKVQSVEKKIGEYTERNLVGYAKVAEQSRKYESFLGKESNDGILVIDDILKMPDGYWTYFSEERDTADKAESVTQFYAYCQARDIQFAYICAPFKVCAEDNGVYGVRDFTNQNADAFLHHLAENGVPFLDLRKNIREQGLKHHELFFKTDHHWKPDTALWAAHEISFWLNDNMGCTIDTELLREDNFTAVKYERHFLGSQGRKVTLALAEPEDINLLYPNFNTFVRIVVPDRRVDKTGNFSVCYDMEQVNGIDYYNKSPYHAYSYGTVPLLKMHNDGAVYHKKIMFVRDSFCDTLCPLFALAVSDLVAVDLRHFTGSLHTLMEAEQPDIVLVLYTASGCGGSFEDKYQDLFFFE